MITFNNFKLRTDEAGKTFLDLEINLELAPQKTIMRLSIPAAAGYQPSVGDSDQQYIDSAGSETPKL